MASSHATTVDEYLAELPAERRDVMSAVRDVVLRNLPDGYRESMQYGMIGYDIPLARYPNTYNGQPLCYAGLAAQKHHYSLYLMCAYGDERASDWLASEFRKAGKKLEMGKSCVRFRTLDDLPLDAIGRFIAHTPPDAFIARYESARAEAAARPARKSAAKAPATAKRAAGKTAVQKTAARKAAARRPAASKRGPSKRATGRAR